VHLALKGWLGRKWSAQVLVGLQAMGSGHLALALPIMIIIKSLGASTSNPKLGLDASTPIPKWGWTSPRPHPSWLWTRPCPTPRGRGRAQAQLGVRTGRFLAQTQPPPSWVWTCPHPTWAGRVQAQPEDGRRGVHAQPQGGRGGIHVNAHP